MKKIKFEYKITVIYLIIGGIWILFSDKFVQAFTKDINFLTQLQTYKGWFYVVATSFLLYFILKKHLGKIRLSEKEMKRHKNNLENLIQEKTEDLDTAISKLSMINEELKNKSTVINTQNYELKSTLKELKDTQDQLLHADKMASLGIMTAGIAHEINNPLNYITGGVTGLESYLSEEELNNEKISLFINSIKAGVQRVSSIVSGLNQMSRNVESLDEKCNINNIIENCLLIMHNQLKDRVEIVKNYSAPQTTTHGNVSQLHQVFSNILLNASQSIKNKGTINIVTKLEENNFNITISDTGCGIPEENLPRITDPFFTTKEPGMGTGLGLSIAYNLIRAHRGNLSFESEVNKGTTVKINLPVKPSLNEQT